MRLSVSREWAVIREPLMCDTFNEVSWWIDVQPFCSACDTLLCCWTHSFFVIVKCICACVCVWVCLCISHIFLDFHSSWLVTMSVSLKQLLSLRVVKRLLSRLCNDEINFQFYTHADCRHTHTHTHTQHLFNIKAFLDSSIHPNDGN